MENNKWTFLNILKNEGFSHLYHTFFVSFYFKENYLDIIVIVILQNIKRSMGGLVMTTKVPMTNEAVKLIRLKEKMDEIIFNDIDTSQNWERAYLSLGELLERFVDYYNTAVANDESPKENTFWMMFLDISSKLIFFHSLSYYKMQTEKSVKVIEEVKELFTIAANCIPNVQKIVNAQFLNEIASSYEELELLNVKEGSFERTILIQNNKPQTCFEHFSKFVQLLKK